MKSNPVCFAAPPEMVPFEVFVGCVLNWRGATGVDDWRRLSESRLWTELCLCILSSRTQFDAAVDAIGRLNRVGLMVRLRKEPELVSYLDVASILRPAKRQQPKVPGIPFWRTRARQLVKAARLFYGGGNEGLRKFLSRFRDSETARSQLVENVPGLGMKQASHFLQNVNFSRDLAVIDTHLVRFLREELMVIDMEPDGLTPGAYVRLEWLIQRIATANGLDMRLLDRTIWSMRRR